MSDDKTEEPTQKKLDDARKEGNVWKSRDLSSLLAFVAAMGVLKATFIDFELKMRELFLFGFEHIAHPQDLRTAMLQLLVLGLQAMLLVSLPIALAAGIAGGLGDFLQVGVLFAFKVLMPKFDKLNPIEGLKNMFSKKQLVEAAKNLFKLAVTAYVVYGVVRDSMRMIVSTIHGDVNLTLSAMGELTYQVSVKSVGLLVVFGIFDVWWQQKTWKKDQMMSKEDVKKEYKESEGDPHHKAHRKEMHREIMEGAQMEAVKGADVVVTNPEHVAVALAYDRERDQAPRVIAKGLELRAQAIRELARAADVPLLRNVPLAHTLLRVEVGEEIPEELYDAVAEVLNFVYQLKEEQRRVLA